MQATLELDMLSVVMMLFAMQPAEAYDQSPSVVHSLILPACLAWLLFAYQWMMWRCQPDFYHRGDQRWGSFFPVVCFFLLHFIGYSSFRKYSPVLVVPLILNSMFSLASYWTGWSFFVDGQNIYRRGPFFLVSTVITLFYYGLSILYLVQSLRRYESSDRLLLLCILVTPIIGFVVQMLFPRVLTLWPGIALSLLLFYLFFLEQRYSIDTLTGLRNRTMFMRDILDLQRTSRDAASIVVLDVNYLKKANDTWGHKAGDELLMHAGSLIERCFRGLGKVYRVGAMSCRYQPKSDKNRARACALMYSSAAGQNDLSLHRAHCGVSRASIICSIPMFCRQCHVPQQGGDETEALGWMVCTIQVGVPSFLNG